MNVKSSDSYFGKLLCIDAGNSFVKTAILEGESVSELSRIRSSLSIARIQKRFEKLARSRRISDLDGIVLCSVVPVLSAPLRSFFREAFSTRLLFVSWRVHLPFAIAVRNPEKVGADRLCAIAGALQPRRRSCIVIDLGSAITVDIISDGRFKGGFIMPGPSMSLMALGSQTGKLPRLSLNYRVAGGDLSIDDTEDSMTSGVLTAAISGVKGAVRELERKEGRVFPKIVSGNAYKWMQTRLPKSWRYDPYLVYEGMAKIWHLSNE